MEGEVGRFSGFEIRDGEVGRSVENGSDTTPLPVLDIFEKVKLW